MWSLIVANNLLPIIQATCYFVFRGIYNSHGPKWISITYNCALMSVACLQVYSGVLLVRSVVRIRQFFVKRKAADYINTRMLLRHAITFGLYITTTVVYFGCFSAYTWYPENDKLKHIMWPLGVFYNAGGTISQLLLVQIFWSLGSKRKAQKPPAKGEPSITEVVVTEFDEDAEL